jgi:signal transduction histidine kinase
MVGEIMGVSWEIDNSRRIGLLAQGFDSILSYEMIQDPDFKKIIDRKVEKARIRQTNRIMQEEYRRFRAALAASPDAFIVLDEERRIFFVSQHYKRAYPGLASRLVRGVHVMDAFKWAMEEQGIGKADPRYLPMKDFWERLYGQAEFTTAEGKIWHIKAAPLTDGQGTIVTTTDITEMVNQKKEIEEKSRLLAVALEKEQEASMLQKQFIGMVSHEFRTPLAIIDGHAQILMKRSDTLGAENIQDRCNTIRRAVSRLVHMMESVLSSNMLKTGRIDPEPEDFNLAALIRDLCDEHAQLSRSCSIICDVDDLPPLVRLDRKMMTLILTNLLSNAIKFVSAENPEIRVKGYCKKGGAIVIEVIDNGIGIPENEQAKIFERYYRASTSAGIPGTGIGLNLVQDLVSLQKGRIEVQSRVGEGTRIILYLQNVN